METLPGYITGFFALLLFSAFVKILTTLNILRLGLGLQGGGFGLVIAGISVALACLVMSPQIEALGGLEALLRGQLASDRSALERSFRPFMEKNSDPAVQQELIGLAARLQRPAAAGAKPAEVEPAPAFQSEARPVPLNVLVPAFLISELTDAFQIGFLILVPFLVLDLLIANILLALGAVQLPQAVVALPLKILLFFAVDGWRLVSEKIIGTYL